MSLATKCTCGKRAYYCGNEPNCPQMLGPKTEISDEQIPVNEDLKPKTEITLESFTFEEIQVLKDICVKTHNFELAAKLRCVEKDNEPTPEISREEIRYLEVSEHDTGEIMGFHFKHYTDNTCDISFCLDTKNIRINEIQFLTKEKFYEIEDTFIGKVLSQIIEEPSVTISSDFGTAGGDESAELTISNDLVQVTNNELKLEWEEITEKFSKKLRTFTTGSEFIHIIRTQPADSEELVSVTYEDFESTRIEVLDIDKFTEKYGIFL